MMKIEVFVVNINYYKKIADITIPLINRYADSLGAKFTCITDQKFPKMHPSYEKLQIYELGKDNDWNISIDADMIIREKMYNVIDLVPDDGQHIGCWEAFSWPNLYNGRGIEVGLASNFIVAPRACRELFKPLDQNEDYNRYCDRPAYVNEYCLSLNRQRLGYKLAGLELPGTRDILFKHLNLVTSKLDLNKAVEEANRFLYSK